MKIENIWYNLRNHYLLLMGEEGTMASIVMILSMILKLIFITLGVSLWIPSGFIFAMPYIIQIALRFSPSKDDSYPLLIVKIAECALGRLDYTSLSVITLSHYIGSIFGVTLVASILPWRYQEALFKFETIDSISLSVGTLSVQNIVSDIIFTCFYCIIIIVAPELLSTNKLSKNIINYLILPLILLKPMLSFHPTATYAIWYLNSKSIYELPVLSMLSSFVGAWLAGRICNRVFPDSPTTWRRK